MTQPDWQALLNQAIGADKRGISGVADRMGISRPYVSRVMAGGFDPVPASFIERVLSVYGQVECPHLRQAIEPATCRQYAGRSYSTINAAEVPHWRACRRCPLNPTHEEVRHD